MVGVRANVGDNFISVLKDMAAKSLDISGVPELLVLVIEARHDMAADNSLLVISKRSETVSHPGQLGVGGVPVIG